MDEADPNMLTTQNYLPSQNTEPPRQITRDELEKSRKSELQKLCREMGLNNVWVRKDQLINMILKKSHTETALDAAHLATPASTSASTNNVDSSHSLRNDTALQLRPHQNKPPPLDNTQSVLDSSTSLLRPNTVPEHRPDAGSELSNDTATEQHLDAAPEQRPDTAPERRTEATPEQHPGAAPEQRPDAVPEPYPVDAPSQRSDNMENTQSHLQENCDPQRIILDDLVREITTIKSKIQTKDNEIELLNTEMKMAYSVIELLQQRVSELEQQKKKNEKQQDTSGSVTRQLNEHEERNNITELPTTSLEERTSANTLLLGDQSIMNIRMSDLTHKCKIRTLHDADFDLMRDWVKEQLNWSPDTCVIYGGMFDLINASVESDIIHNLSALIYELKNINENMSVYVSKIVPCPQNESMQTRISDLNDEIEKWGEVNTIPIINTDPSFKLGTGEIDESCFQMSAPYGASLNRLGAVRLLKAIGKQCDKLRDCVNWNNLQKRLGQYQDLQHSEPRHTLLRRNNQQQQQQQQQQQHHHQQQQQQSRSCNGDGEWQTVRRRHRNSGFGHQPAFEGTTGAPGGRGQPQPPTHSSPWPRTSGRGHTSNYHVGPPFQHQGPYSETHNPQPRTHIQHRRQSHIPDRQFEGRLYGRRGCYRCGEFNHHESRCRFDHKLQCSSCYQLGHKSRLCYLYSK